MSSLILPKRFKPDFRLPGVKPVGAVEIDWSNPIAGGLKDAFFFKSSEDFMKNLAGSDDLVIGSNASTGVVDGKEQLSLNTNTSVIERAAAGQAGSCRKDITVLTFVTPRRKAVGQDVAAISRWNTGASGGSNEWNMSLNFHTTSTDYSPAFQVEISTTSYLAKYTAQWNIGVQERLAGVRRGTQIEIHRDGFSPVITTGISAGDINDVSARNFNIGSIATAATYNTNADYELALVFDRALSEAEINSLFENPYQLLKPVNAPLYFVPAAGGVTVSPGNGTLTHTGQAPTVALSDNQTVSPANDTLVYTGQVPVVVTGNDQVVSPANASLSYTGQPPVVVASDNQTVSPANDTLSYTGQAPVVAISDHQVVQPANDTLTYTGQAPVIALSDHQVAAPANGTLTHTGQVPVVVIGGNQVVAPANDTLTYTGQTPAVLTPVAVSPANDTLSYTGQSPVVAVSDNQAVSPANDTLTYTGQVPVVALSDNQTVQPAAVTLSLVGQSPTVAVSDHKVLTPAQGVLTLVGQSPSVVIGGNISVAPGNASLTYTGQVPGIVTGGILTPSFRTLTVSAESRILTVSASAA